MKPQCNTSADCLRELARVMDQFGLNSTYGALNSKYIIVKGEYNVFLDFTTPSNWQFAIAEVEGKPVFVGDELYQQAHDRKIIAIGYREGFIICDKYAYPITSLSWTQPHPATVMVELPYDFVVERINFGGITTLTKACKLALEKLTRSKIISLAVEHGVLDSPNDDNVMEVRRVTDFAKACAAIKDAEIASRDLMIKELRDALIGFMGNPNFDGEPFRKGAEALANSEHHNSEVLAHADDIAVDNFAVAMKAKLAAKRKQGKSGWQFKDACSNQFLSDELVKHISKGDPVDVANFCMMLQQRGETIDSKVLDKMLLDDRMDTLERVAEWHPIEGNWQDFVRSLIWDCKVKLAELNKE